MPAEHITDANFGEKVEKSSLPVLVDFFAEWCGPCKMAAPIIDKLAGEFAGKVNVFKMDVDANPAKPGELGIMSIPTVILYVGGKEKQRKVGFQNEAGYRTILDSATV